LGFDALKSLIETTDADRTDLIDIELIEPSSLVDAYTPMAEYEIAVSRQRTLSVGVTTPHHTPNLGASILQGEVAVA
jgi:hypothetical protein